MHLVLLSGAPELRCPCGRRNHLTREIVFGLTRYDPSQLPNRLAVCFPLTDLGYLVLGEEWLPTHPDAVLFRKLSAFAGPNLD